jgi:hypothetical protein
MLVWTMLWNQCEHSGGRLSLEESQETFPSAGSKGVKITQVKQCQQILRQDKVHPFREPANILEYLVPFGPYPGKKVIQHMVHSTNKDSEA